MIPGFLISWITFPGVIIHELGHQIFCILTGTRVRRVCYFRLFKNPPGYVIHDEASNVWKHIMIGFGPLIVNTVIGLALGITATFFRHRTGDMRLVYFGLIWLGVAIAMHSFPSTGDAKALWDAIWGPRSSILAKLVGMPLVGVIYLGALASMFWADVIYGVAIAIGIPMILLGLR